MIKFSCLPVAFLQLKYEKLHVLQRFQSHTSRLIADLKSSSAVAGLVANGIL